jgi:hypothetical protein
MAGLVCISREWGLQALESTYAVNTPLLVAVCGHRGRIWPFSAKVPRPPRGHTFFVRCLDFAHFNCIQASGRPNAAQIHPQKGWFPQSRYDDRKARFLRYTESRLIRTGRMSPHAPTGLCPAPEPLTRARSEDHDAPLCKARKESEPRSVDSIKTAREQHRLNCLGW